MTNILTTKEVADKLHMGINQTRELINRKDFPKVKVGQRKWLIPEDALDEWISRNLGRDLS